MKLLIFLAIQLILSGEAWGGAKGETEYLPVADGMTVTTKSPEKLPNSDLTSLQVQQITANKAEHLHTGTQKDIEEFNKNESWGPNDVAHPRPFQNNTNSYWLNPGFQFGPGSVNDLGGDPNAEGMLQPYVF